MTIQSISREEYDRIDAVNQSRLKLFSRSPAHARQMILHPPAPTAAMTLGQAVHAAVLGPAEFKLDFAAAPKIDRRTKAGRTQWDEFVDANEEKIVLTDDEYNQCLAISRAVWSNPTAAELLSGQGTNELTCQWTDTGLACKSRIDRFSSIGGKPAVIDLKTTRDAGPDAFGREIAKYLYHLQAAWYLRGLRALSDMPRRFMIIAAEKTPPYCTCIYEVEGAALLEGDRLATEYLGRYAHCLDTDQWPGYPAGIIAAQLPRWAVEGHTDE